MLCENCKIREANIKYTEIINGSKTEHNLCSHCAREMDFGPYSSILDGEFPFGKLLSSLLGLETDEKETAVKGKVVCPTCGTSFEDFVENSRFGCADCYGVFDLFISDKMKQLQGSESHKGKLPKFKHTVQGQRSDGEGEGSAGEGLKETLDGERSGRECSQRAGVNRQIRELEGRLKKALLREDYEEAAGLRDRIKELKKEAGVNE